MVLPNSKNNQITKGGGWEQMRVAKKAMCLKDSLLFGVEQFFTCLHVTYNYMSRLCDEGSRYGIIYSVTCRDLIRARLFLFAFVLYLY